MALLETRIKRAGQLGAQQFVTTTVYIGGCLFYDNAKAEELQHEGSIVGGSECQWFRTARKYTM